MIGFLLSISLFQAVAANNVGPVPAGAGTAAGKLPPPPPKRWMTLTGDRPEIVALGGYAGLYPSSSQPAYDFAVESGIQGTILYCNLHFTKENDGFCIAQMNLANSTDIDMLDPKGAKTYNIYGQPVHGWFGLDYPAQFIFENVTLRQNIFSRIGVFDGAPIMSPFQIQEDKFFTRPTRVWLNIENDLFYNQHKISPERYLLEMLEKLPEFISSPEIGFLKAIEPKLGGVKTKLVFVFLEPTRLEPNTNMTYGELVKNLPMIKSFAYGIVVPKDYIWPVDKSRSLQPATNLVPDAHKLGLSVYVSGFANDYYLSYNYSYDPAREYLQFVDNSRFSVDGLLTESPSTASEVVGCLNPDKNAPGEVKTLIMSHNGASGDYPGATDLAYQKAIDDGADIIDCSIEMSKDGIAFCSDRSDLLKTTTAATLFMDLSTNIPEIQSADGVFSFDLSWSEIQSLKPQLESPYNEELARNPAHKNSGKFMTLAEFLELAKTKAVPGVLVNIKNAAFLAKRGLDVVGVVQGVLKNATLDKQRVLIQSDDTSVLLKFKDNPNYQRVLYLKESIGGVPEQVAKEIKKYADAVFVPKKAAMVLSSYFIVNFTNTIPALQAANISVYIGVLKNEFQSLVFDYLNDPYLELATYHSWRVDGFVTDYPATAKMFTRSSCTTGRSLYTIQPVKPGFLFIDDAAPKLPLLNTTEVVAPPLPAVAKNVSSDPAAGSAPTTGAPPPGSSSSSPSITVSTEGLLMTTMLAALTIFT